MAKILLSLLSINAIHMKKITLIISLLLSLFCTSQAKDRVIERPPFIAWNSTNIEIDKLVISDTETVAYIKAFSQPNSEIKIATGSYLKDNNGHLYPIRKGIGITLDKEFRLSESGEGEFQLVFPPLPLSITTVDFSEGDFKGAYKIWGIQLNPETFAKFTLPKGVTVSKADKKLILPEPINKYSKATIKGRILDYQIDMPTKGNIYLDDAIRGVTAEDKISIEKDGTFYKEVDAFTVTPVYIDILKQTIDCLIAPGETTYITINLREITRQQSRLHSGNKPCAKKVYYSGYLANLQQELSDYQVDFTLYDEMYEQMLKSINGKTPEEYKAYTLKRIPDIRNRIATSKRSPAWKEIQNSTIDFLVGMTILETERNMKISHIRKHNMNREEADKYFYKATIDIPQSYYQYMKELPSLNSSKACYTHTYTVFLDVIAKVLNTEKMIEKGLGTNKGYLFDNIKTYKMGETIRDFRPLNTEQKKQLDELPKSYRSMIEVMNNDLLKRIEINKKKNRFTINETGQVSNEDLFPSIIAKFQGHTLLVDFWATWCGPCKMANKTMLPMKENLKDKDILFIYITGETSPLETWNNMIPDIQGEHFRVTESQWSYLRSHFNIEGVPTYFVIDKEGNITYRETGFPGVDIMKEQLMKALDSD